MPDDQSRLSSCLLWCSWNPTGRRERSVLHQRQTLSVIFYLKAQIMILPWLNFFFFFWFSGSISYSIRVIICSFSIFYPWIVQPIASPYTEYATRPNTDIYWGIILSDKWHHSSLSLFQIMAGSAVLTTIPIWHVWQSKRFSSISCSHYHIFTYLLTTFKKVLKMFSFGSKTGIKSDITYLSFLEVRYANTKWLTTMPLHIDVFTSIFLYGLFGESVSNSD